MQSITQQFIAIAKKIREHLAELNATLGTLKNDVQRIANEYSADRNERKTKEDKPIPNLPPPSSPEESDSYSAKHYALDQRRYTVECWTLAFLAIYAGFAALQWCTMKKTYGQIKAQTGVVQIDQRPWIGLARIEQEQQSGTSGTITFRLIFKNYGKTPPTGLFIDANRVDNTTNKDRTGAFDEMDLRCKKGETYADTNPRFRTWTILPGSEIMTSDFQDREKNDPPSKNFTNIQTSAIENMKEPYIAGCIRYNTQFDSCLHQTGFYSPLKDSTGVVLVGVGKHLDVYATNVDEPCHQH